MRRTIDRIGVAACIALLSVPVTAGPAQAARS